MKSWYTHGAFGDTVAELSLWDILRLLCGCEIKPDRGSTVICFGRSKRVATGGASREEQLRRTGRPQTALFRYVGHKLEKRDARGQWCAVVTRDDMEEARDGFRASGPWNAI